MSKYLLSVHMVDGQAPPSMSPDQMQQRMTAIRALEADMEAEGAWFFGGALTGPDAARVVDATGADTVTTDGPFAESKEFMAGVYIIEAPDHDAAFDWAQRVSDCIDRPIEVRPFAATGHA